MSGRRYNHLPVVAHTRLNLACMPISEAFGCRPYLVGSVTERPDYRDVDVRTILADDEFDALFGSRPELWSLFCLAVSAYLAQQTGLPVDYQVQRLTEANERSGVRSALAMPHRHAGGGDATRFEDGS